MRPQVCLKRESSVAGLEIIDYWSNSLCNYLVPSRPAQSIYIHHFYLIMECCCTGPTSQFDGSDNTKFMTGSSDHMITQWPWPSDQSLLGPGPPRWFSGKESICNIGDMGLIPGQGRSSRQGNGSSLQYSCQGNPMDRGVRGLQSMGSQRVGQD